MLILPEIAMNVLGTIWSFCGIIECFNNEDYFANTIVEGETRINKYVK